MLHLEAAASPRNQLTMISAADFPCATGPVHPCPPADVQTTHPGLAFCRTEFRFRRSPGRQGSNTSEQSCLGRSLRTSNFHMAIGKKVSPRVLSVRNPGTNDRKFIRVHIVIRPVLQNFKTVGLNAGINIRRQIVLQLVEAARKFSAVVFRIGLEELADLPQLIDINGPPRLDDGGRGSPLVQLLPQLLATRSEVGPEQRTIGTGADRERPECNYLDTAAHRLQAPLGSLSMKAT